MNLFITPLVVAPPVSLSLGLVVKGENDGIYWNGFDSSWIGWQQLPGSTPGSPTSVIYQGDMHIVVRGSDNGIYHGWVDLSTRVFSGWTKIDGSTPSAPALTVTANSLILGVRGSDNKIYYREWKGSWNTWKTVPGVTPTTPGVTALGDILHFVVKGVDNRMYHGILDLATESWNGWTPMSGSTPSAPSLTDDGESIYLTVRGNDDKLYIVQYLDMWSTWNTVPGSTDTVVGTTLSNGDLALLVKGIDNRIYYGTIALPGETFSGWSQVGGSTPNSGSICSYLFDTRVSPSTLSQGDTLYAYLSGNPSTNYASSIEFQKSLIPDSGDEYTWTFYDVYVPFDVDSVSIVAENVVSLRVEVTVLGFPIVINGVVENGVGVVTVSSVLSLLFDVEISGTAIQDAEMVPIFVTVSGSVDTNPDGIYSLSYDTSYLPVGDFSVTVEHIEKIVTVNP